MRKFLKISLITLSSILGLVVVVVGLIFLILTPARLTPLVNKVATDYLDATVKFDTVDLTLLEDFPLISLRLKNGSVISHAFRGQADSIREMIPLRADTLLTFKDFVVSGNILDIVRGKYSIRRVRLTSPNIYAYVAPGGKANWDILKVDSLSDSDTTASVPLDFAVSRISLRRTARLEYNSRPDSMVLRLAFRRFSISGNITNDIAVSQLKRLTLAQLTMDASLERENIRFTANIDTLGIAGVDSLGRNQFNIDLRSRYTLAMDTVSYCHDFPLNLSGGFGVAIDGSSSSAILRNLALDMDVMRLVASGDVALQSDSIINSNLNLSIDSLNFARLVELIPSVVMPQIKKVRTNLITSLNCQINGKYNINSSSVLPRVRVDIVSNDGFLSYGRMKEQIKHVKLDGYAVFDPQHPDSCGGEIRTLDLQGRSIDLHATAQAWDVMRDARVESKVKGVIHLDTLAALFAPESGVVMQGSADLDFKGKFRLSDLTLARIGGADIRARLSLDSVRVSMPQDSIYAMVGGGRLTVGANENKRDSLMDKGARVLRASVRVDTAFVNFKEQYIARLSKVKAKVRIAASAFSERPAVTQADTLSDPAAIRAKLAAERRTIHPFTGSFSGKRIQVVTADSSIIRLVDGNCNFSILPSKEDATRPLIKAHVDAKTLLLRSGVDRIRIAKADIEFAASSSRPSAAAVARRERRTDSLAGVYPLVARDSLMAHVRKIRAAKGLKPSDDFKDEDIDLGIDGPIAKVFRRWRFSGDIKAERIRLTSPIFPLRNVIRKVDVGFSNKELEIRSGKVRSGQSQIDLRGKISNIQRAILNKGTLRVNVGIESDTLNLNELVRAANAGAAYGSTTAPAVDIEDDEQLQEMLDKSMEQNSQNALLVIPGNIEAHVNLKVHYAVYADLGIDSLSGSLDVKDRVLQLNNLYTKTQAGEIALTALYATVSKTDIRAGFDLEMNDMQVDRLIELIPMVDSVAPMLRSFEGRVNCQIAATSAIDTSMNLILPTLNAAARLSGEDMVLLDGQTFTEISKMLMFKNKKRNKIDKISIEMLIRDNQIEMFPFVMQIDRYKTAISGVHKLDMNFNYHISVLKSPLPFRIGIDVFGNLDDFDFKIGRAKYKSEFVPRYIELVDTTRVNLRRAIADISKRGIDAAAKGSFDITKNITAAPIDTLATEPLTAADSLALRKEGLIDAKTFISLDAKAVASETQKEAKKPKKRPRKSKAEALVDEVATKESPVEEVVVE